MTCSVFLRCGDPGGSAHDRFDLDRRQLLTVTVPANVVLTTAELEDHQLLAEPLLDDLGGDLRAGDDRGADRHVSVIRGHEEHLVEGDLITFIAWELLDPQSLAW